jgi:DNA polymerase III subunit delta
VAMGKPLPMALREQRIWGLKEKRFERVLPRLDVSDLALWVRHAHVVDGIVKGLRHADWPNDPWQALLAWAMPVCLACRPAQAASRLKPVSA